MLDNMNREAVQIICSECGEGAYRRDVITSKVCCGHCGHHIYSGDIELEEGEELTWLVDRTLGYTPALDCADMFGHHSEDRVSVYRGRGLQTMCGRHASEL